MKKIILVGIAIILILLFLYGYRIYYSPGPFSEIPCETYGGTCRENECKGYENGYIEVVGRIENCKDPSQVCCKALKINNSAT